MKETNPPMLTSEAVLTETLYFLREDGVSMDLADASIVVMSELDARSRVLTVDRTDFSVYRRHDRRVIDFVASPKR